MGDLVKLFAGSLLFIALGVGLNGLAGSWRSKVEGLPGWPAVRGEMKSIAIVERPGGSDGVESGFSPRIEYSYVVAGKEYTGRRIALGARTWSASRETVQAWLAPYSGSKAVTVYHDPKDLASAVLDRGDHDRSSGAAMVMAWILIGVGGLGILAGGVIIVRERGG